MDLKKNLAKIVKCSRHTTNEIHILLKKYGAHKFCHVISEDPEIDARIMLLEDALDATVGVGFGTIIGCIPGKLTYYEGEDQSCRFILIRSTLAA